MRSIGLSDPQTRSAITSGGVDEQNHNVNQRGIPPIKQEATKHLPVKATSRVEGRYQFRQCPDTGGNRLLHKCSGPNKLRGQSSPRLFAVTVSH
jgi:hypothetical protein